MICYSAQKVVQESSDGQGWPQGFLSWPSPLPPKTLTPHKGQGFGDPYPSKTLTLGKPSGFVICSVYFWCFWSAFVCFEPLKKMRVLEGSLMVYPYPWRRVGGSWICTLTPHLPLPSKNPGGFSNPCLSLLPLEYYLKPTYLEKVASSSTQVTSDVFLMKAIYWYEARL